jgi:haloacetate dehalogenase
MNGDPASAEEDLQELFPGFSQLRVPLADGTSMRVVTGGTGPAVLLLHGYPETLCAWHRVAPALAGKFCVVAADLPGYGGSFVSRTSETVVSPSRRAIAAALLEMMDRLGHERFMAVGHDRGARAAYRMAIDAPGRVAAVASLTVIPTIDVWEGIDGDFALRAPHWFLFAQPADVLEKLLSHDPVGYLQAVLGGMAGGLANIDPRAFKDYAIAFGRRDVREAIYRDYKAGLEIDLVHERTDRLAGIGLQCPVLFLWDERGGRGAELLGIWRRWAGDVTGAGLAGGHLQPEMAPDAVLSQLLSFLARCSAQAESSTRRHAAH